MKKKILVFALTIGMIAIAITSFTLAYFTDTKSATNTFTVGNVSIKLIEQQRGENGLEDFEQSKKLYPIVGSAQGDKDKYGMPTAKNYVDKMVTIKNTGTESAYIRAYFAIPSALDDGSDTFNASLNTLHFNFGNKVVNGTVSSTYQVEWIWKHGTTDLKWNYFETTIDGIAYNVYFADYYQPLEAGETTERFVNGVYLDKSFNIVGNEAYVYNEKTKLTEKITLDEGWDWSNVSCPVYAIACQSEGFASATEAFDAAFGANYNPWGTTATNWQ